jgi:hypothetical protein
MAQTIYGKASSTVFTVLNTGYNLYFCEVQIGTTILQI